LLRVVRGLEVGIVWVWVGAGTSFGVDAHVGAVKQQMWMMRLLMLLGLLASQRARVAVTTVIAW